MSQIVIPKRGRERTLELQAFAFELKKVSKQIGFRKKRTEIVSQFQTFREKTGLQEAIENALELMEE